MYKQLPLEQFMFRPNPKVFDQEFGHLHLEKDPFKISPITIRIKDTIVCLFEIDFGDVLHINLDQFPPKTKIEEVKSISFLFEYESWTEDHGVILFYQTHTEESAAKIGRTRNRLRRFYRQAKERMLADGRTKIVYEGNRNEG